MLREAQTGTEGHVIGVDETCGGVLLPGWGFIATDLASVSKFRKRRGVCLFIR